MRKGRASVEEENPYIRDLALIRQDLAAIPENERVFLFYPDYEEEQAEDFEDLRDFYQDDQMESINAFLDSTQYGERDRLYTRLLREYINQNQSKARRNHSYKLWFFILTMAISFGGVIFMAGLAAAIVARKPNTSLADVGIALSAAASLISAIFVLPKTIANHLFPMNEDEYLIRLVEKMQENDSRLRSDYR